MKKIFCILLLIASIIACNNIKKQEKQDGLNEIQLENFRIGE